MIQSLVTLLVFGLIAATNGLPSRPFRNTRSFGTLIVGGENATQGELPYQIDLRYSNQSICGGSLVLVKGHQAVLTAAHCVDFGHPSNFTVTAGELSLSNYSGFEQTRRVSKIAIHENYGIFGVENDIALLLLNGTFNLTTKNVAPIPLPSRGQNTSGEVLVSGWGSLSNNGPYPDILQKVKLPVVNDTACAAAYSNELYVNSMICTGVPEGGKDSCDGDSGGPVKALNGSYLAGIVSWGYDCAAPGYPGVNTEVSHFIDWIESKV